MQTEVIILIGVTFLLRRMIPDHLLILKEERNQFAVAHVGMILTPNQSFHMSFAGDVRYYIPGVTHFS